MFFYYPRCLSETKLTHWAVTVTCAKELDSFSPDLWPFAKKNTTHKKLSFIGLEYSSSHSNSKKTPQGKEGLNIERKLKRGKEGSNFSYNFLFI